MTTEENKIFIADRLQQILFRAISKAVTSNAYKVNLLDGTNRASSVGGGLCNRKSVFDNVLAWKPSEFMQYASLTGILVHYALQGLIREMIKNVEIEGEIRLDLKDTYGLGIIGHYDLLVVEVVDQNGDEHIIVIDIKTVADIKGDPFRPPHYGQLMFYLAYIKKQTPNKSVLGALWYVDRNYSDPRLLDIINPKYWKILVFDFDQELLDRRSNIGRIIHENLNKDILPPVLSPNNYYSWLCRRKFCPYREICFDKPLTSFSELLVLAEMTEEEYHKTTVSFWNG